jgi:PII-like signaling protein
MKIEHNGTLMRVYVSQSNYRGHSVVSALIVDALVDSGIAGATVFLGIAGYGSHHIVSSANVVDAYCDLPVLIEVVEADEKIRAFIPKLESILEDGLVTLERLQTIFYRSRDVDD